MIIAIDGPAASGKGWVSRKLCEKCGYTNFATGEIFRTYAHFMFSPQYLWTADEVFKNIENGNIVYQWNKDTCQSSVLYNGKDITRGLYSSEVSNGASIVGKEYTHDVIKAIQFIGGRMLTRGESLIVEGRNVASVLFPESDYKFYLDASVEVRAKRRVLDYKKRGEEKSLDEMIQDLKERDYRDSSREIAPLKQVDDAVYIDSGNKNGEETIKEFLDTLNMR